MKRPAISIVLPFHNAEQTLSETIDSIRRQTFGDFELLAVDDGSDDGSPGLLRDYARRDPRIRLLQPGRLGIVGALNAGLAAAGAPLVARMDADDIMQPERLEKQKRLLDERPDIALAGTRVELFPDHLVQAGFREYVRWQNGCVEPEQIAEAIYVELPIAHPSFMFRKDAILRRGGYRSGPFPEDYELLLRLAHHGERMAKVPEVLLRWRESGNRLTRTDERYAREAFDRVRAAYLACDPRLHGRRPLAFWGAGRKTRRRAAHLIGHGLRPAAWVDIDPRKIGNRLSGVPVVAPDWLDQERRPFVLSYVANHGARELIAGQLEGLGYRRGEDYLMVG